MTSSEGSASRQVLLLQWRDDLPSLFQLPVVLPDRFNLLFLSLLSLSLDLGCRRMPARQFLNDGPAEHWCPGPLMLRPYGAIEIRLSLFNFILWQDANRSSVYRIISCAIDAGFMARSRADNGSHFMTHDPHDPSVNWPVTRVTRDPWLTTSLQLLSRLRMP